VLGDQALELAHEVGVAPEGEVGLDSLFERPQVQLLQACDRRLGERLV
jgi:hypothetical protein